MLWNQDVASLKIICSKLDHAHEQPNATFEEPDLACKNPFPDCPETRLCAFIQIVISNPDRLTSRLQIQRALSGVQLFPFLLFRNWSSCFSGVSFRTCTTGLMLRSKSLTCHYLVFDCPDARASASPGCHFRFGPFNRADYCYIQRARLGVQLFSSGLSSNQLRCFHPGSHFGPGPCARAARPRHLLCAAQQEAGLHQRLLQPGGRAPPKLRLW
jgi:hypothetical protein